MLGKSLVRRALVADQERLALLKIVDGCHVEDMSVRTAQRELDPLDLRRMLFKHA